MKRFVRTLLISSSVFALAAFMSCTVNANPEKVIEYVEVDKIVYVDKPVEVEKEVIVEKEVEVIKTETVYVYKLTETETAASTVWYFQESVDGNAYVLKEKLDEEIPAGTDMEEFCKNYAGFDFFCMTQTGPLIFVFYDRKEITYTFDAGDKGTFSNGSPVMTVTKLYGAPVEEPVKPESDDYRFISWCTESGAALDSTYGLENKTYYATWIAKDNVPNGFVLVLADTFTLTEELTPASSVMLVGTEYKIPNLVVSKYEVTVDDYYDITGENPSDSTVLSGETNLNPVNRVSWYDTLVYCNMRSIKEKYTPCYSINGSTDPSEWGSVPVVNNDEWNAVVCDFTADGYRLPTTVEWEYLARGARTLNEETGNMEFQSYKFSGSNTLNDVAVTQGGKTKEVGSLAPNTLDIYDMTGNVWEWIWDTYTKNDSCIATVRGSAIGSDTIKYPVNYPGVEKNPSFTQNNFGFRVVRTAF